MAQSAPRIVRLDEYRRNTWSAIDLTWEHMALKAVEALARGERLRAAMLLPQAESIARTQTMRDDPRRAATLTLLARWQLSLGNREAAGRLQAEAERAWCAAALWVERLRPGATPEGQAECRRMLQRATIFAASLATGAEGGGPPADSIALVGLSPDRRKLEVAVSVAMASLEAAGPELGEALP